MFDTIIIGGGPSGSAAGRISGKKGLNTLLLEKAEFPRHKPCGGALSEHAISYLDFNIPEYIIEKNIYGVRVHYKDNIIEKKRKERLGILVTRSILDDFLLKKAEESGIVIKQGERAIDFKETSENVEVITQYASYQTRYVIIAEGAQGQLKNKIRRRDRKNECGLCVVTEIETENKILDEYPLDLVDFHFGVAPGVTGWIFPHKDYFNIGIGGFLKYLNNPFKIMKNFLKLNGFKCEYKLKGHIIPAGGINRKLISSRIVLIGDSAGFVDPFYGEGIAYAIRSGQIAANIISDIIINNKNNKNLRRYEDICNIEFGNNLKYSLKLNKLMYFLPEIFFKIFTKNEDVIDKFLDVINLRMTYKDFINWFLLRIPKYLMV